MPDLVAAAITIIITQLPLVVAWMPLISDRFGWMR